MSLCPLTVDQFLETLPKSWELKVSYYYGQDFILFTPGNNLDGLLVNMISPNRYSAGHVKNLNELVEYYGHFTYNEVIELIYRQEIKDDDETV